MGQEYSCWKKCCNLILEFKTLNTLLKNFQQYLEKIIGVIKLLPEAMLLGGRDCCSDSRLGYNQFHQGFAIKHCILHYVEITLIYDFFGGIYHNDLCLKRFMLLVKLIKWILFNLGKTTYTSDLIYTFGAKSMHIQVWECRYIKLNL